MAQASLFKDQPTDDPNRWMGAWCPKCEKAGSTVYRTENFGTFTRRERICRRIQCRHHFFTTEERDKPEAT